MGVPGREAPRAPARASAPARKPLELAAVAALLVLAVTAMPGGLTPHRRRLGLSGGVAEVVDVVSAASPRIAAGGATLPIDAVHARGLPHRGAWIIVVDDALRVLLLWRAPRMVTCPRSWSLAGEHAVAGESFADAAVRGLEEEVEFLGEAELHQLGTPFLFRHAYETRLGVRVDVQWTSSFVAWSRHFSVDLSQLHVRSGAAAAENPVVASSSADDVDVDAAQTGAASAANGTREDMREDTRENTRMVGLPLLKVAGLALQAGGLFCNEEQRTWLLRTLVLAVRVLRVNKPRAFRQHVRDGWRSLEASGASVCCHTSESEKHLDNVDVAACALKCSAPNATTLADWTRSTKIYSFGTERR